MLYEEGEEAPKMLSIGLHCRLIGRPGRFRALQRFLDYVQSHERVWVCRRVDIARHWAEHHPYQPKADRGRARVHASWPVRTTS
ncbi:urate catabolism protein [Alcaligenes sp. HPC1271]|nr:urate catabolism protein [Alcaligenes sp. HPC1271]